MTNKADVKEIVERSTAALQKIMGPIYITSHFTVDFFG